MRPSYKCETCKLSFKHKCDFLRHQTKKKSCLPPGRSRYVCDLCTRTFSRSAKLQAHLKSAAHRARVVETGGTLEALEGEDAPAPETSVEPEVPEEVPVIDLSPCTVCDTVPFTSELRRDNHYNSQTHRDALRRAERRRAREEEAIAAAEVDEELGESSDPMLIRDVYDDEAARGDVEDSDEEDPPYQISDPIPDHLQAAFDANPFCIPSSDEWIIAGLTEDQAVRFVSLQPDGASGAFPVTFDLLWPALGYADHQEAAEVLVARFTVGQDYVRGTRRTYLTTVTAQLMAHTAPGPDAASIRGMYARVHERAQEHDVLTRLQEVFRAARLARHESVLANCLERGYVYLSQPMLINGIWRAKPGHTDGTLKERYHGLRSQFGSGESQFLFDRVARADNSSAVEDALLTKSRLSSKRCPVALPNGNKSTETFEIGTMTRRDIHREFDRIARLHGRMFESVKTESERRDTERYTHIERCSELALRQEAERTQQGRNLVRLAEIELESQRHESIGA